MVKRRKGEKEKNSLNSFVPFPLLPISPFRPANPYPRISMSTQSLTLIPTPPYSFDLTVHRFARFKDEIVDRVVPDQYQRLLFVGRDLALATVTDEGTIAKPLLRVELEGKGKVDLNRPEFAAQLRHILCTDLDLKPFYRLAKQDELLATIAPQFRGLKLVQSPTVFEALVVAVLAQQVNLTFAYSIKKELVETFGETWKTNRKTHYAFPDPARFAEQKEEDLLRFRLSRAKAGTLVRLGQAFASGTVQETALWKSSDGGDTWKDISKNKGLNSKLSPKLPNDMNLLKIP